MADVILFPTVCAQGAAFDKADELAAALAQLTELAGRTYHVENGEMNEIAIAHNGHVLGVWAIIDGYYTYTGVSSRKPTFKCRDLSRVLQQTRKLLAGCPSDRSSQRERRRHQRWPVQWSARVRANGAEQTSIVEDISAGGVRVRGKEGLSLGDSAVLEVRSRIRLTGSVVWLTPAQFGFAYRYPLDAGNPLLTAARCTAMEG